ncbi:hypothetical protein ALI22I_14625 [Saccharothrix sp. ALI-22-I]|nr:hypothetical protein ALI22I_14625 [Saccharothrix sp. ALI-22-I]
MERRHALAHRLLNLPEPHYGQGDELVDKIANASEAKATVYDMFLTLAAMEESLQRDSWRPMGTDSLYMSMLIELGYHMRNRHRPRRRLPALLGAHQPRRRSPPPNHPLLRTVT